MELWRSIFRFGITPYLSHAALIALRNGLLRDDPRLAQGVITSPPCGSVFCGETPWQVDAIAYGPWMAGECRFVAEVDLKWKNITLLASMTTASGGHVAEFLRWYDETPRDEMRTALLGEVELALFKKAVA